MEEPSEPQTSTEPQPQGKKKKERKPFISPSSSFVDFAKLEREIYNSNDKINNEYDPYAERQLRKPITDLETLSHLAKGCIGAGLLAMPRGFLCAGSVLGTIGTFFLGWLLGYGIHIMLKMKYLQCKWLKVPFLALPRALKVAFLNGPPPFPHLAWSAPFIADFFLAANQIGLCTCYVLFIASSFKRILEPSVFKDLNIRIYLCALFLPTLLVNYIRNLKKLSFVSGIANFLMFAAIGLCFYYIFAVGPWAVSTPGQIAAVAPVHSWPFFASITIFAIDAVGVMITLEHNMKQPSHFLGRWGIFPWSMACITTLYVAVGLCTYLKYGKETGPTMVSSLPDGEWMSVACQALVALGIFGSYPIQLYVGLEIIWGNYLTHYVKNRDIEWLLEYILRTAVVVFTFFLAMIAPQIDLVISLVGSFCLSIVSLVIPFLFELCTRYGDYGCLKYVMIKDIIGILLGLTVLTIGTFTSVKAIIDFNWGEEIFGPTFKKNI